MLFERKKQIVAFLLCFSMAFCLLYLTFYCAFLFHQNKMLQLRYAEILTHHLEITKDITRIKDALTKLEESSVSLNQQLHMKLNEFTSVHSGTDLTLFDRVPTLATNFFDLNQILNQIDESRQNLRLSKSMANSIPFHYPTVGPVNSLFGARMSPTTGEQKIHKGIDIAANTGQPVYATAQGVIEFAGIEGKYGRMILIDHPFGFKTRYAHLNQVRIKAKQKVKRGQLIGIVGESGATTGAHLHYEIMLNDHAVDPMPFLNHEGFDLFAEAATDHNKTSVGTTPKYALTRDDATKELTPVFLKFAFALGIIFISLLLFALINFKLILLTNLIETWWQRRHATQNRQVPVLYWPTKRWRRRDRP